MNKLGNGRFAHYAVGVNNVGSYQVAGVPFITGSNGLRTGQEKKISFPMVTKRVSVMRHTSASAGKMRVHFNSTGSGAVVAGYHFIELDSDEDSFDFGIKCKEIYVSNAGSATQEFRIYAELTQIPTGSMFTLTGSGLTEEPTAR